MDEPITWLPGGQLRREIEWDRLRQIEQAARDFCEVQHISWEESAKHAWSIETGKRYKDTFDALEAALA